MDIQRLPAGEVGYAGWYDVVRAAWAVDEPDLPPPSRRGTYGGLAWDWPAERTEHWVARDGAEVSGVAELTLPQRDNVENAGLELVVHPAHRRRGIGGALVAHCLGRARAAARKRIALEVLETRPGGVARSPGPAAFAAAHGATRALEEVRRRLVISEADQPRLDTALDDARRHAAGYSLVRWDEGGAPDDVVAGIAELDSDFLNQAPLGELVWEAEKVDVARIRGVEQVVRNRGWRRCHTAVRHDASGDVVGWTALGFDAEINEAAWQGITLVRPDHRGHRLGTVVKLENLRYARRRFPALRTIHTTNATVNDHMVAINDLMGFRPLDLTVTWQLDL